MAATMGSHRGPPVRPGRTPPPSGSAADRRWRDRRRSAGWPLKTLMSTMTRPRVHHPGRCGRRARSRSADRLWRGLAPDGAGDHLSELLELREAPMSSCPSRWAAVRDGVSAGRVEAVDLRQIDRGLLAPARVFRRSDARPISTAVQHRRCGGRRPPPGAWLQFEIGGIRRQDSGSPASAFCLERLCRLILEHRASSPCA